MLSHCTFSRLSGCAKRRQNGVVMLVALIVLVVMTLAGLALMRSMDTTNLIAGNMAFKQAATLSADTGIETAIGWLEMNNTGAFLDADSPQVGYKASTLNNAAYHDGEAFWADVSGPSGANVCNLPMAGGVCVTSPGTPDAAGNYVSFVIQRLCNSAGPRSSSFCAVVAGTTAASGSSTNSGVNQSTASSTDVMYRITVRTVGPRNTVSYVQAMVSM